MGELCPMGTVASSLMKAPPPAAGTMMITVPQGSSGGQQLTVQTASGPMTCLVPQGMVPGNQFMIQTQQPAPGPPIYQQQQQQVLAAPAPHAVPPSGPVRSWQKAHPMFLSNGLKNTAVLQQPVLQQVNLRDKKRSTQGSCIECGVWMKTQVDITSTSCCGMHTEVTHVCPICHCVLMDSRHRGTGGGGTG